MNELFRRNVVDAGRLLAKDPTITHSELPWRKEKNPYRIFLAEMLLVRTRVDVVARSFEGIFSNFPDISNLASASEKELNVALFPLGLSKRVPLIIRAARYILDTYKGKIPNDIDSLLTIPGIGKYTAYAILTFAYNQKYVPADVNILRFLSRFTGLPMQNATKGSKELTELAQELSEKETGLKAEVLLDFTILVCKPRSPKCPKCCIKSECAFFQENC